MDAQSVNETSFAGLSSESKPGSPSSSQDSLVQALTTLTAVMADQNRALWALVHQTASMIEILVESGIAAHDDEDDSPKTYLDGTPIGGN